MRDGATFLLLCLIWGTTWMAVKVALESGHPLWLAADRFGIAGAGLAIYAFATRAPWPSGAAAWRLNLLLALFMFAVPYVLVFWGMRHVTSGQAAVLYAVHPFFMAVAAHRWIAGDRFTARRVAGMALGFAGVAVIFWRELSSVSEASVAGGAAVVTSALCGTLATVAAKNGLSSQHPATATAAQLILGAALLLPAAALLAPPGGERWNPTYGASVAYLGLAGTSLTFTLYYWLLQRLKATTLSLISFVTPVVAVATGAVFLNEPLRPGLLAGTAMVTGGVLLATLGRVSPRAEPAASETAGA